MLQGEFEKIADLNVVHLESDHFKKLLEEHFVKFKEQDIIRIKSYFNESDIINQRRWVGLGEHPTDFEIELLHQLQDFFITQQLFYKPLSYLEVG